MSDLKTNTYRPGAGEYAWTFGGAALVFCGPVFVLRASRPAPEASQAGAKREPG